MSLRFNILIIAFLPFGRLFGRPFGWLPLGLLGPDPIPGPFGLLKPDPDPEGGRIPEPDPDPEGGRI